MPRVQSEAVLWHCFCVLPVILRPPCDAYLVWQARLAGTTWQTSTYRLQSLTNTTRSRRKRTSSTPAVQQRGRGRVTLRRRRALTQRRQTLVQQQRLGMGILALGHQSRARRVQRRQRRGQRLQHPAALRG